MLKLKRFSKQEKKKWLLSSWQALYRFIIKQCYQLNKFIISFAYCFAQHDVSLTGQEASNLFCGLF